MLQKETRFMLALAVTLGIEAPVFALLRRVWRKLVPVRDRTTATIASPGSAIAPPRQAIVLPIAASLLTLPYVWFVIPRIVPGYFAALAVSEAFALFVEAFFYAVFGRLPLAFCLASSFACNALSFLAGFFILPLVYSAI